MKKIIAGNWKMNGTREELNAMLIALENVKTENKVIICLPFTLLGVQGNCDFGAQDCSTHEKGQYTGEVSAEMIAATGAKYVIVGHSDRRKYHNETNEIVREKATRAADAGLIPIVCVGDTLQDRQAGKFMEIVAEQVKNSAPLAPFILAYEPVWAISPNPAATARDIAPMHAKIASIVGPECIAILYGGSANGGNVAEIVAIPHVDGVLAGAASLKPEDFIPTIEGVDN
ncbi:MAG: triose-phosphate isomerase [Alphaproteobacteria bacterium]|nr:triose-phosphate isomerase [Alphaproteobacteria bacterium]